MWPAVHHPQAMFAELQGAGANAYILSGSYCLGTWVGFGEVCLMPVLCLMCCLCAWRCLCSVGNPNMWDYLGPNQKP